MKIEKNPSGSYRIRKYVNGKSVCIYFDHKPSQKEVALCLAERLENIEEKKSKSSFKECAKEYVATKENILSPSTIRNYTRMIDRLSDDFLATNIYDLDQLRIQKEINDYCENRSPKTVRNMNGFISAILTLFRPNFKYTITLPQRKEYKPYFPKEEEIKALLDATEGTYYHRLFQLGILGLRRSEVAAITKDDINGNMLTINKALVQDDDNVWVVKATKTEKSERTIYIPDSLAKELKECDEICPIHPNDILVGLHSYQDKLNIPHFRFHDFRHFYASYCHHNGMSEADIMKSGGWSSNYTLLKVYRHEMDIENEQKRIASQIFG